MRMRASVAVVSGALALSALAVPAAQADGDRPETISEAFRPVTVSEAFQPVTVSEAFRAAGDRVGEIGKVTANGGKDVVIGLSKKKITVDVMYRPEGVDVQAFVKLYRGVLSDGEAQPDSSMFASSSDIVSATRTHYTDRTVFDADPKNDGFHPNLANKDAGVWKVYVSTGQEQQDIPYDEKLEAATVKVKRAAKLTVDAAPGSVRRGADVAVKGDLTRANWDTNAYGGFLSNSVKLQFKKRGGSWATVKTVSADSQGKVSTTVKASVDGEYRFTYGGSTTTGGATSAADFVDVR
ncbi:calcium-binding protein [Streptomyces sp. JNUCC 64]